MAGNVAGQAPAFARFPAVRDNMLRDVVNPASVPCEACQAKRGQRCVRLRLGQEYHQVRWVDALTAGR